MRVTAGLALSKRAVPPTAGFRSAEAGLRLSAQPQALDSEYALVNFSVCDRQQRRIGFKGLNRHE